METQFFVWVKRQDFFVTFCRNGHVFLLLNSEEKFQVYIVIYGSWLFLFVSELV